MAVWIYVLASFLACRECVLEERRYMLSWLHVAAKHMLTNCTLLSVNWNVSGPENIFLFQENTCRVQC